MTLAEQLSEAITRRLGPPTVSAEEYAAWSLGSDFHIVVQSGPSSDLAFLWLPWPDIARSLPPGAWVFPIGADRFSGLTTGATPSLDLTASVISIRVDDATQVDPAITVAIDNPPAQRGSPAEHAGDETARNRGRVTDRFVRSGWGLIAIATALLAARLSYPLSADSAPSTHGLIVGVSLLVISFITFVLLVWPSMSVLVNAALGALGAVTVLTFATTDTTPTGLALGVVPLAWLTLQFWLLWQWWDLHNTGPIGAFDLHSLPRAKYLPTLIGMSTTLLWTFDWLSNQVVGVGIIKAMPLALQGTSPPIADQIEALLSRLPTIQYSLYWILLGASSALALLAGDTNLISTYREWADKRARGVREIETVLLEPRSMDPDDATLRKRMSNELAHLIVHLQILGYGLLLAARSFPKLMGAAIWDLLETALINVKAAVLLTARLATGAPVSVACGVVFMFAVEELISTAIGIRAYWHWSAPTTLLAIFLTSFLICLIADSQQIRRYLRQSQKTRNVGISFWGRPTGSYLVTDDKGPGLVLYALRAFAFVFVILPISIALMLGITWFLESIGAIHLASIAIPESGALRWGSRIVMWVWLVSAAIGLISIIAPHARLSSFVVNCFGRWRSLATLDVFAAPPTQDLGPPPTCEASESVGGSDDASLTTGTVRNETARTIPSSSD